MGLRKGPMIFRACSRMRSNSGLVKRLNVKTYRALPAYLGWYPIPEPKDYFDDCIAAELEKAVNELKPSFRNMTGSAGQRKEYQNG